MRHGHTITLRRHLRLTVIRANGLNDVVGAFVCVDDLRIRHPFPRFAETVTSGQCVPERCLVARSAPLGDPQHLDAVDTVTVECICAKIF